MVPLVVLIEELTLSLEFLVEIVAGLGRVVTVIDGVCVFRTAEFSKECVLVDPGVQGHGKG